MAKAACVELRLVAGANYDDGIEILRKHFMECGGFDFVTQDDELNIDIEFTSDQELLNAGILLGELKEKLKGFFYVLFTTIGA